MFRIVFEREIALIAGALLLLASGLAQGHQLGNLTRAQEGRAEVAKCYARCLANPEPSTEIQVALDAGDGEWSTATRQYVACLSASANAQSQDACRAGCVDIEVAYGTRTSYIRTRYYWHLNRYLRDIRAAGLWRAWNDFPEAGTDAFIRACSRYIDIRTKRTAAAASKLEKMKEEDLGALEGRLQEVIEKEYWPAAPPLTEFELHED